MGPRPRFASLPRLGAAFAILCTIVLGSGRASAQVVINEIFPNPVGTETGFDEVVEIYNAGPNPVDMTGWAIDDLATIGTVSTRARIPEDLVSTCSLNPVIGPGEIRLVRGQSSAAWL